MISAALLGNERAVGSTRPGRFFCQVFFMVSVRGYELAIVGYNDTNAVSSK